MWEELKEYGHINYFFLTYIQKLHKDLYSCRYIASRQSHDVEEENLSSEEGTLPWFSSGDRLGGLGVRLGCVITAFINSNFSTLQTKVEIVRNVFYSKSVNIC